MTVTVLTLIAMSVAAIPPPRHCCPCTLVHMGSAELLLTNKLELGCNSSAVLRQVFSSHKGPPCRTPKWEAKSRAL
eukprot:4352482-Amphidinium_carterae.1